jgi:type IX secretion system substrate protein
MKIKFTLFITALLLMSLQAQAQRYLTEVFTDVNVTSGVQYATNITVISGAPEPENLYVNIYEPEGDTVTDRPVVIYAHTGSFLPVPLNGQATGDTSDYTVTEVCTRLAKMGYVAASFTYRKGWNPLDTTAELRRRGLINAAYKGVQDFRTVVRFFRDSEANGNPYGIHGDKIAGWGQGTGGYITSAAACLEQEELYIPKFQDPITGESFIDTTLWGNIDGTSSGLATIPNLVGYSSDIALSFNVAGALGDVSWLDPGDPPIMAAHPIKDPFAPFGMDFVSGEINCEGPVIVPTTGEFVVNVAGSKCIVNTANGSGLNDDLLNVSDPLTQELEAQWLAEPNLWAIWTETPQAGPWEYWNAAFWGTVPHPSCGAVPPPDCSFHTIGLLTNPDMSLAKANAYIDTLIGFFAPRANHILNVITATEEILQDVNIGIYPNPAGDYVTVELLDGQLMESVQLFGLQGQLISSSPGVQAPSFQIQRNGLPPGMYLLKIRLKEGIAARKIMFR